MRKKLLSLVIAVAIILSIPMAAYADDTAAAVQNSVAVLATIEQIDGSNQLYSWGTCFFVGKSNEDPEYLFTAAHVVSEYMNYGQGSTVQANASDGSTHTLKIILRVYFGANDFAEAYVVSYDEEQDIALLKLNGTTSKRTAVKLMTPTDSMAGDNLYCVGFPGLVDGDVMSPTSVWGVSDSVVSSGTLGRIVTSSGTGTKWLQIPNANWLSGNSGGPVCIDGAVVGIVSMAYGEESSSGEMYAAASIEAGITMLRNNNIEFDEAGTGINMLIVYIAGGVLLAAIIALVIILIVKKNKKKDKKKKEEEAAAKEEEEIAKRNVVQQRPKTPTIQSFAAQHHGAKMVCTVTPIMIGRAQNCRLRYEENTPCVSREHCSIVYEENTESFVLRDLKSTYGTFLANGQKLVPLAEYRLKSGDSFYVGDSSNMLRVDLI